MSERYQRAVSRWAAAQPIDVRFADLYDTQKHFVSDRKTDACRLDPESIALVTFQAVEEGGCETCSYTFVQAQFIGSCVCGVVKNQSFSIDTQSKDLAQILEEVMACEPYVIETF